MTEQRKEIGYYNTSTKDVIPGYSAVYHALSASAGDLDDNGNVSFVENINGQPRELTANVKGQLILDRDRRGGERLWQRIYDEADLVAKLEAKGVQVKPVDDKTSPKGPVTTIVDNSDDDNLSEQDAGGLSFKPVVENDGDEFDAE